MAPELPPSYGYMTRKQIKAAGLMPNPTPNLTPVELDALKKDCLRRHAPEAEEIRLRAKMTTPKLTAAEEAIREAVTTATAAWTERWKSERSKRPEATPHFEDELVKCLLPLLGAATRKAFEQAADELDGIASQPFDTARWIELKELVDLWRRRALAKAEEQCDEH